MDPVSGGISRTLLLMTGACVFLAGLMWSVTERPREPTEVLTMRNHWSGHALPHYRLTGSEMRGSVRCTWDVEVQEEHLRTTFANTCGRTALTVSDLFTQISDTTRLFADARLKVCPGFYGVQAWYDPILGYPTGMHVTWEGTGAQTPCTVIAAGLPQFQVESLTPLP